MTTPPPFESMSVEERTAILGALAHRLRIPHVSLSVIAIQFASCCWHSVFD